MSFLLSTYYNVIIAWALFYLVYSFFDPLPWKGCNNEWNSELCWNGTQLVNATADDVPDANKTSAPQEFYESVLLSHAQITSNINKDLFFFYCSRNLLQMTTGIENFGAMRWELVGALAVAWILVYFCLWKGIKSSGKVVR